MRGRGFSSIEFFAAAVIGMILTVVAVAGYRVYQRQMPVKFTAQRLVHGFSAARAFAVAHNSYFTLQLDLGHRTFWIDQVDATGAPVAPKVVNPEMLDEKVAVEGVQFGQNPPPPNIIVPIRFFPDGSSDDVHIFLRMKADNAAADANIFTVRLYGPTGMSRLFENRRL